MLMRTVHFFVLVAAFIVVFHDHCFGHCILTHDDLTAIALEVN